MGTDIHGVFQRNDNGDWVDVESTYERERHYDLFAALAGKRNGYGFAGVKTGEAIKPISLPRGLPDGFAFNNAECHPVEKFEHLDARTRKYHSSEDKLELWMGDQDYSWLSGSEMMDWYAWYAAAPTIIKTGVLDRDYYDVWDKKSEPEEYCVGVFGNDVIQINDNELEKVSKPNWTHIRCEWEQSMKDSLAYFFDEVARLMKEHGEIRYVFGFDS
jgi:hypothetical protein